MRRTDFKNTQRFQHVSSSVLSDIMEAGGGLPNVDTYLDVHTGEGYQVRVHVDLYRIAPASNGQSAPPYGPWLALDP